MKAKINGIEVEGTPQEIMEFQRLQDERNAQRLREMPNYPLSPPSIMPLPPFVPTSDSLDWVIRPDITCYN